jgi:hypothetical protein
VRARARAHALACAAAAAAAALVARGAFLACALRRWLRRRRRVRPRSKKYLIEKLQGEKIVSRQKGVTTTAWHARKNTHASVMHPCFHAPALTRALRARAPRSVSAVAASSETPDFIGLPGGLKVSASVAPSCAAVALPGRFERVSDIRPACVPACRGACEGALTARSALAKATTGYALPADDAARLGRACVRACGVECLKPGRAFDFAVPFRP